MKKKIKTTHPIRKIPYVPNPVSNYTLNPVNTIALENLVLWTIVSFCENAAELGCPRNKDVDMWIREIAEDNPKKARKIMEKLFDIMERQ